MSHISLDLHPFPHCELHPSGPHSLPSQFGTHSHFPLLQMVPAKQNSTVAHSLQGSASNWAPHLMTLVFVSLHFSGSVSSHSSVQSALQLLFEQLWPGGQSPQLPLQPLDPHCLPSHWGTHSQRPVLSLQLWFVAQPGAQLPPQPSGPHFLPTQLLSQTHLPSRQTVPWSQSSVF